MRDPHTLCYIHRHSNCNTTYQHQHSYKYCFNYKHRHGYGAYAHQHGVAKQHIYTCTPLRVGLARVWPP